jgi:hypothetical protein
MVFSPHTVILDKEEMRAGKDLSITLCSERTPPFRGEIERGVFQSTPPRVGSDAVYYIFISKPQEYYLATPYTHMGRHRHMLLFLPGWLHASRIGGNHQFLGHKI